MTTTMLTEKSINPRLAIELAILEFEPNISNEDLINKREEIMLRAHSMTPSNGNASMYVRDYCIYSQRMKA